MTSIGANVAALNEAIAGVAAARPHPVRGVMCSHAWPAGSQ